MRLTNQHGDAKIRDNQIEYYEFLSYQERLRDWPCEARQPARDARCQILQSEIALGDK